MIIKWDFKCIWFITYASISVVYKKYSAIQKNNGKKNSEQINKRSARVPTLLCSKRQRAVLMYASLEVVCLIFGPTLTSCVTIPTMPAWFFY